MAKSKPKTKSKIVRPTSHRIVIEIIVRTESGAITAKVARPLLEEGFRDARAAALTSNFSYVFDLSNMRILHFITGETRLDDPPDSGSFFAPVMDPSDPPKIRMTVVAIATNPGSSGTLSVRYLGMAVFDPGKNIPMRTGKGGFDEIIKLPS